MMWIETRIGDLDIGKTKKDIEKDVLFELFLTEPQAIEAALSEGATLIDNAENKVNQVLKNLEKVKE